jgi:hypothetical protein|tara:strand:+ start:565 stop:792 length:228 start_codon:yes stop_codon:yes gene_type:complete
MVAFNNSEGLSSSQIGRITRLIAVPMYVFMTEEEVPVITKEVEEMALHFYEQDVMFNMTANAIVAQINEIVKRGE